MGTPVNGRSSCIGIDRYIPNGTYIRQAEQQAEALHPTFKIVSDSKHLRSN